MNADRYREHIRSARDIVLEAELGLTSPEWQLAAFEIVLKHLIESDKEVDEYTSEIEFQKRLESAREERRDRD